MRLTKMLGLALVAAIAAMAFVGAGTASAVTDEVAICGEDPGENLCPSGKILPQGATILGVAGPSELLGTINQKCESSHAAFTISSAGGMGLGLQLAPVGNGLSFTGCKPCEKVITTIGTSTLTHLENASKDYNLKGTGSAKLINCTFGVDCGFEGTADLLVLLTATGTVIHAEEEKLERTEGSALLCGSSGKWDALYTITGHWAALVTHL